MRTVIKYLILLLIGGFTYLLSEIIWRGYTHWAMFIVGAIAFILMGNINEFFSYNMPLVLQCGISTIMILLLEFISGVILNIWLQWHVWDYSNLPLNIYGQVCLYYGILWYFLSAVGIIIDDIARWKLFNEEKPHYTIFI